MNRAQEEQFVDEHTSSWQTVKSTWLSFVFIIGAIVLYAWSPLASSSVRACPVPHYDWYDAAPRLQHSDDDPDEFFDPSEH